MSEARLPCAWAPADDALYRAYHDTEWGVPERDPRALWEKLQLDGMQAGLSWITILRKRETIRAEFDGFDPERLARWTPARIGRALENPGIIRSAKKIEATIGNARAYLDMQEAGEDFADYCWGWVDGRPVVGGWRDFREAPTFTPWSEAMSKDLKKRGFKFVGPTIVYAWAQAVGMVNDHEIGCPRHKAVGRAPMKTLRQMGLLGAAALVVAAGGCRSSEPVSAYANPVDACAAITDLEDRERCMKNIVADVAASAKREQERRRSPR